MSHVSVITVNFNHHSVTEALLASLFNVNNYRDIEIIVVDNGSDDNPVPGWVARYPLVKFIHSDENLGFAGGNNLGIKEASGRYLFFINNDTEVTGSTIGQLSGTLDRHPEIGMVSPKIKYFDQPDVLQYAGFSKMNYYTARTSCIGQGEVDRGQYDNLTGETGYIHGAAMMVRREAIDKAGMMPENYFLYYEEMDWCEQIRRAGYKIWVDMQAEIYHKESVSVGNDSPLKEYFMNRNRILFIRRNCGVGTKAIFWSYFLLIVTPRNMLTYVLKRQWRFAGVLLKAIGWNIANATNSRNLGYPLKIKK